MLTKVISAKKKGCKTTVQGFSDGVHIKLDPCWWSKIVSIILKGGVSLARAIARKHHWNMTINLDLQKKLTNTSTCLTLSNQTFYKSSDISKEDLL